MSRLSPLRSPRCLSPLAVACDLRPREGVGNLDACGCSPWCVRLQALGHAVAGSGARGCRPWRTRLQAVVPAAAAWI